MTETATGTRLNPKEREAIIDRLREFGEHQDKAAELADQGSLDRARDLLRLWNDGSFEEELPAPGPRSKIPLGDFRRFKKWANDNRRLGLSPRYISYLEHAAKTELHISELVPEIAQPASELVLRPLWWFIKQDHGPDALAETWRMAVELAEGESPSHSQVVAAVKRWKQKNLEQPERRTATTVPKLSKRQRLNRAIREMRELIQEMPEAYVAYRQIIQEEEAAQAAAAAALQAELDT